MRSMRSDNDIPLTGGECRWFEDSEDLVRHIEDSIRNGDFELMGVMDILRIDIAVKNHVYTVQVLGMRGDLMGVLHNDQSVEIDRQTSTSQSFPYFAQRSQDFAAWIGDTITATVGTQQCIVTIAPLRPEVMRNDDSIATVYFNGLGLEGILEEDFLSL